MRTGPRRFDGWLFLHSMVVALGFGGFLVWACLVPLSEGVTTGGQIIVEQNTKTLQHLEGGIVRAIFVEEGDQVDEGQLLYEIDALAMTSNREQVALERAALLANTERLSALLQSLETLTFQTAESWNISAPERASIIDEQLNLFEEQRQNHAARLALLDQRIRSLAAGKQQHEAQLLAIRNSIAAVNKELAITRQLVEDRLARADEALRLEREKLRFESDEASLEKQAVESAARIQEIRKEIDQTESTFREELSLELVRTRTAIAQSDEKLKAIDDAVFRSRVLAPETGQVMNVKFSTVGGVVQPGEPMLEIVPASSGLWASVQIAPKDRDTISVGMPVRVRLAGFKSWKTPDIGGTVVSVSADLKTPTENGVSFYEARILLDQNDLESASLPPILPGMPVEAFVDSGQDRTLAEYIIEPIYDQLKKGLASG